MNRRFAKFTSFLLLFVMLLSMLPAEVLAYFAGPPTAGITITDTDGNRVTAHESWNEVFPYGTFAFANSQVTVEEGGESVRVSVYRLGGTTGRVILRLMYMPAYAEIAKGQYTYANAAGKNNITIEVENPLPIAKYQPLGKDPEPREPETPTDIEITDNGDETYTLTPAVEFAEAYQWYAWANGDWNIVADAAERHFVVDLEYYPGDEYDYMCVYPIGGVSYGSNSAAGDVYVKPQEDLGEEISDQEYAAFLMQQPEQSFSTLPMDSPDEYSGYIFDMTFADGEWVKEIILTAPDNGVTEPDKFGRVREGRYLS